MERENKRIGWLLSSLMLIPLESAWAQPPCDPLPAPTGTVIEVHPTQNGSLRDIVASAATGTTILLHPGIYDMSQGDASSRLVFDIPGVTLRSFDGDRDSVVLDGAYQTNELVSIHASDVAIASLTLRRAYDHPVHISGRSGSPISGILLHDLEITDPGQQAIKINAIDDGYADNGVVECSHIELTPQGRSQVRDNCYTGGIDAHAARGWSVRANHIEGFWCDNGLSEHGVHFWRASRDTRVERNVILNCARGIGFGLGDQGGSRIYVDDPYPGVADKGHIDGLVRNNFVAVADPDLQSSGSGFDVGIGLEQSHGTVVVHNSVISGQQPSSSSIEWRFPATSAEIVNNLVSHNLKQRDGGVAVLAGNISSAPLAWFQSLVLGDLHLISDGVGAVGAGSALPPGQADRDFDGELRGSPRDVGADELGHIFADGFEGGDLAAWSGSQ